LFRYVYTAKPSNPICSKPVLKMPSDSEKLEKLREAVEKAPKRDADSTVYDLPAGEIDVDKIIKRYREADTATRASLASDSRVSEIKARVEGESDSSKLDFNHVIFKERTRAPFLSDSSLSFVGKFYESFEAPVSAAALFFARARPVKDLKQSLDAADIGLTAEAYLVVCSVFAIFAAVFCFLIGAIVSAAFVADPVIAAIIPLILPIFGFLGGGLLAVAFPSQRASSRAEKINRELPFALRHLATQIKSGVSFHRALKSVASADYGLLSAELEKTLRDMEKGSSTEEALTALAGRTASKGLKKSIVQIIRALRTGGNLSELISGIAEDVSFESKMLVRDFVERLNIVSVVYIMVGVVAPVVITILAAVTQLPMINAGLSFEIVVAIFMADLGAMALVIFAVTKMEPSV